MKPSSCVPTRSTTTHYNGYNYSWSHLIFLFQLDSLEEYFVINENPKIKERRQIAENLDLTEETVRVSNVTMKTSCHGHIFHITGPLCGESVVRSFDVFFVVILNKHSSCWWFDAMRLMWRHSNDYLFIFYHFCCKAVPGIVHVTWLPLLNLPW